MAIAQVRLDELWDFSDPVASEVRLRAAAAAATGADRPELLTQAARALGLQGLFPAADALLDDVLEGPFGRVPVVQTRCALERGRLRNSAGDAPAAIPLLRAAARTAAARTAAATHDAFLQVDALHMLAIADRPHADEWTDAALAALDDVTDARTLRWRVSLLNNRGWTRFDGGLFAEALASFAASREAAIHWGTPEQIGWADEAIATTRAALAAEH